MNFQKNGTESEFEFWPLEHPTEPSEEDKPVKCPMPYSSAANNNSRESDQLMMHDSLRKRTEFSTTTTNRGRISIELGEPPAQAVRKRHHPLSRGDSTVPTSLARAPPLYRRSTSSLPSAMSFIRFNKFGS
ncbi:hypothetical protein Leryth_002924 [Lithospermum erythrorhizon]|uniref:Uncharacterized protein n=1 Tax=Lithospermum erythrorhizon TaxID=34254 RepID=A0AAV3P8H3_LITER|nr:hypothetical protein Leryth_002924 [Lithospermum erythrorhizon]